MTVKAITTIEEEFQKAGKKGMKWHTHMVTVGQGLSRQVHEHFKSQGHKVALSNAGPTEHTLRVTHTLGSGDKLQNHIWEKFPGASVKVKSSESVDRLKRKSKEKKEVFKPLFLKEGTVRSSKHSTLGWSKEGRNN